VHPEDRQQAQENESVSTAEKKTYEVLAEVGVTTCFALYGDGNMDWGTTLADLPNYR
jgi:hypothetical protein